MPKTRQQKEETVTNISDKLTKAKAVVFADYKGMTMSQFAALRKQLRDIDSEFAVTKNSLLKLALRSTNYQLPTDNLFQGPLATLFAYDDEVTPIKILAKAFKDFGLGEIKFGFLGTEALDGSRVNQLAALPAKDQLRGQAVGVLAAPLQGMMSVLQGNLRNLVYAIEQIRLSRGGE